MPLPREASPPSPDRSWLRLIPVFLLYLGLSLRAYWPVLSTLDSALVGVARGDAMRNAWGYWWTRFMLVDHLRWPAWTDMLNYPYGQVILTIDSWNCLLSLPLQVLLGFPAGYNAFLVCATAFSGLGGFLLARHLTGSEPAALVAGALYGLAPYTLCAALAGTTEVLNVGWIPLFYLFLHRSLTRGTRRDGILAGVFLVCTTMANWYFGFMASLFAVPVVLAGLWGKQGVPRQARLRSLEWTLLVFGLFTLAMLLVYGEVAGHVLGSMETGEPFRQRLIRASINLGDLLQPTPQDWQRPSLYHLPHLAFLLAGLGLLATMLSMSYQGQTAPWLPGPLQPALAPLSRAAAGLYDLFLHLPGAGMIRFPMRWMVLANLAAGLLAALGLARLLRPLPKAPALLVGLGLAVALVEGSLESSRFHEVLETIPMPGSACLEATRRDPEPGAVAHIPERWSPGTQLLEQTLHQRPLVMTLDLVTARIRRAPNGNPSSWLFPVVAEKESYAYDPVLRAWPSTGGEPLSVRKPELGLQSIGALRALKVRFLVLHRDMFQPEDLEFFQSQMAPYLELVAREGATALYRVTDPARGTARRGAAPQGASR